MTTAPTIDPTNPSGQPAELVELVAQAFADVAAAAAEEVSVPPASTLREAAVELLDDLAAHPKSHGHLVPECSWCAGYAAAERDAGLSTSSGDDDAPRPPRVETDRDAVRVVEAVIIDHLTSSGVGTYTTDAQDLAERIVHALLGTPTVTLAADGRPVVDWHDGPGRTPRVTLVARPLLDELVAARDVAVSAAARAAIDVILDTAVGIRDILHNPADRNAHAGRMFDEAARELDSLRAAWPRDLVAYPRDPRDVAPEVAALTDLARAPRGVLVVPASTTDEVLAALRASAGADVEVRRTHPDDGDVVEHITRPAPWPDPEVAVDLIDHTDEHVSPDCKAGKCGACTGGAWSVEADAHVDCTHPCHTPAPVEP